MHRVMRTTRRDFFKRSGMVAAGLAVFGRPASAIVIPSTSRARRLSPSAFLSDPPSPDHFRRLAQLAMDAARSAKADYADIRIGVQRRVSVPPLPYNPYVGLEVSYGIRARMQGTWSFEFGNVLSDDAIVAATDSAVTGAIRSAATNARLGRRNPAPLAPSPVVTGEWRGPNVVDPFAIPLDDYYRVMGERSVTHAPIYANKSWGGGGALDWLAETRVFASTDGSLTTQHWMRGGPNVGGSARLPDDPNMFVGIDLKDSSPQSGGFELALNPEWSAPLMAGLDEAVRLRELPYRPFQDVGRFPVIFGGQIFASVIADLSLALDGERVAGDESDASGDSYLVPPETVLGASQPPFSPLLNMHVGTALPDPNVVAWDDEGVTPESYPLLERGRVVDYHTTRTTAPMFASWYRQQGRPLCAHGTVVSRNAASLPIGTSGHVHVNPATTPATIEELAREIQHGFIAGNTADLEVQRGKIVARTTFEMQIVPRLVLKSKLEALGDASTVRTKSIPIYKGVPWESVDVPVTVPAALFKDIDIIMRR